LPAVDCQVTIALPRASLATWGTTAFPGAERLITEPSRPLAEMRRALMRELLPLSSSCDQTAIAAPRAPMAIVGPPDSAFAPPRGLPAICGQSGFSAAPERVLTGPRAPAAEICRSSMRHFCPSYCDQTAIALPSASTVVLGPLASIAERLTGAEKAACAGAAR